MREVSFEIYYPIHLPPSDLGRWTIGVKMGTDIAKHVRRIAAQFLLAPKAVFNLYLIYANHMHNFTNLQIHVLPIKSV